MREGWEVKRLSDCIKLKSGNNLTSKNMIHGDIPVYGGNGISGYHNQYNLEGNQIVIGRVGALCGNVRYIDERIWLTDNAFKVSEFKYDFDYEFLTYLLNEVNLRNYARQSAQPVISNSSIKDVLLTFPISVSEQKRIVKTLDLAFKQIDRAKENLEKNLNNAKELFASKLNEVFSQRGEGWEEKTLKEVCEITSKLIDPKEEKYQDLVHIGAGNIASEKGTLSNLQTAKEENLISGKFLFDEEMVLYSKIRPYLMKVVKCEFIGLCSADIYPLVPIENEITQSLLYYLLLSNNFTEYAIEGSQRAGMPKVNRKHLFEYSFYLPNIKEQEEETKVLDKLFEISLNLQTHYQDKLNNLEELKKSILEKAFKGEL